MVKYNYGLIGTFVIDNSMTICTVQVNKEKFDRMLKKSLIYLLGWLQKSVLICNKGFKLKEKLMLGLNMTCDTNTYLLSYYQTVKNKYKHIKDLNIDTKFNKYSINDIVDNTINIVKLNNIYLLFVKVYHNTEKHFDMIPLLALSDI